MRAPKRIPAFAGPVIFASFDPQSSLLQVQSTIRRSCAMIILIDPNLIDYYLLHGRRDTACDQGGGPISFLISSRLILLSVRSRIGGQCIENLLKLKCLESPTALSRPTLRLDSDTLIRLINDGIRLDLCVLHCGKHYVSV